MISPRCRTHRSSHRQRLAVPSHRELFLRLGRRLLYNTGGLFPSPVNEDRSKINIKVATAEFEPKCGGRLYYVNDAKLGAHAESCTETNGRDT